MSLPFLAARGVVLTEVAALVRARRLPSEAAPLDEALGRTLAAAVTADRDQPPFHRVTRDGFAVRAVDVAAAPVRLSVVGEVPAGATYAGTLGPGQCVEIMTGAPLPAGADAVVMVEHTERPGPGEVVIQRAIAAHEHYVPRGSELAAGAVALAAGVRLDPAAIALLASVGCARPSVYARPRVAILPTGDEIVPLDAVPTPAQIRNSNRHSLAAQVVEAGGTPWPLPVVKDEPAALEAALAEAAAGADLVLVTGGVSMGKYDFVEQVLARLQARLLFDSVAIRPGKPLVFGFLAGKPFFGLPGNPLSTMVTFSLFVRPALALLAGGTAPPLRPLQARLAEPYTQKKLPLTVFVPALLGDGEGLEAVVRPLPSQGSGDLGAMARAEALLVVPPETTSLAAGAWVPVLPK